jgi:exonuclease III
LIVGLCICGLKMESFSDSPAIDSGVYSSAASAQNQQKYTCAFYYIKKSGNSTRFKYQPLEFYFNKSGRVITLQLTRVIVLYNYTSRNKTFLVTLLLASESFILCIGLRKIKFFFSIRNSQVKLT